MKKNNILRTLTCLFALAYGATSPNILAQENPKEEITDPVLLSLAAGYKATFTCSSYFLSGRTIEQINGDELHRIYPGYRAALAQLPAAEIDEGNKTISVRYSENFPPRIAIANDRLGCKQLPAGLDAKSLEGTKGISDKNNLARQKRTFWPQGDKVKGRLFMNTRKGRAFKKQVARAFDRKTYGEGTETTAVLVIKDGKIIGEKYRDGFDKHTPQRTWSVAKSIAATILGAAIYDEKITLKDSNLLNQWSSANDPRGDITLENLLHMASGLDNGPRGNRTDDIYFGGGRVIDHAATRRLIVAPGSRWYYANNDTMLAMRALREKISEEGNSPAAFNAYPFEALLGKIGMNHTYPETDWNGDFILSSQVYTTARDLGRLGLLYLNNGIWPYGKNEERIFPEWWADYVQTPAPSQPPDRADGSKRFGYGAQFWLLGGFENLPEDSYAALGNRGQSLVIIPSKQLLIIRRGFDDNGGARFDVARFASDMVSQLSDSGPEN